VTYPSWYMVFIPEVFPSAAVGSIEEVRRSLSGGGALDITFYQDDLDQIGMRTPAKTDIPLI